MTAAPSIANYYVGKGTVQFTPDGGVAFMLGNCPEFEFTANIETLDHYSSQAGVRSKDRSVTLSKGGTLRIVMDEFSEENLRLALMGSSDTGTFDLLANDEITGEVVFTGTNSIGPKVRVTFNSVSFKPSSALNLISDEWGQIEVSGEVLAVAGDFGTVDYVNEGGTLPAVSGA